jgi:TetR/AcrR family transcriptional repressor of nem operon
MQLSKTKDSYVKSLRDFFDDFLRYFKGNEFKGGCPIANFSMEMSDINENIRKKLDLAFYEMNKKISLFLEKAKKNGELSLNFDIDRASNFILNSWEGALLRIKASKNSAPMKLFNDFVFQKLLVHS